MPRPEHIRFLRKVLEPEILLASHRVLLGKRDHESQSARRLGDHAFRLQRKADESHVDMASTNGIDLGLRSQILEDDADGRSVLGEEAESLAQQEPVGLRGNTNLKLTRLTPRRLSGETGGSLRRGKNAAGFLQE